MKALFRKATTLFDLCVCHVVRKKRIVWVDGGNWAGIQWGNIFSKPYWASRLYDFSDIGVPTLITMGKEASGGALKYAVNESNYWILDYKGYNLWELAKVGVCASMQCSEVTDWQDERVRRIAGFYFEQVAYMIEGLLGYVKRDRVDCFFVSQGCTPMSRPVVEVGRRMGINVVAIETSFLGNYLFMDNATGMIVNRHAASRLVGDFYRAFALTGDSRKQYRERMARQRRQKMSDHVTGMSKGGVGFPDGVGAGRRKLALFIGQVISDSSLAMDGGNFKCSCDLIVRCIEFFCRQPGWTLVIRLHPKESNGESWANSAAFFGPPPGEPEGFLPYGDQTYQQLVERLGKASGEHFTILSGTDVSTEALMDAADVGITINSQAGFEMACKYKRVVVCGDAFYARKGFTFDVASASALESVLRAALEDPGMSEKERYRVDQYGNYLLSQFLFPRDMNGHWARFAQLLEPSAGGTRLRLVRRAVAQWETLSREGEVFSVCL